MEIALALCSFVIVLGACALAARNRPPLLPLPAERVEVPGEPGFLRRLAS